MSSHGSHGPDKSPTVSVQDKHEHQPPETTIPFTGRFLDGNDGATKARTLYIKILFQRTCLIIVAMFAIFSIYWGALSEIPARSMEGWIVDFDGGWIGETVTQELDRLSGPAISWVVHPAQEFPNGSSDLASAVVEEHCWVAVAIHIGSTAKLDAALAAMVDPPYNGSSAITAYGVEARNENAFRTLLRPDMEDSLQNITHNIAVKLFTELASNPDTNVSSIAPEVLVRPVYYTLVNLRPFDAPVATAATFVGLIYMLILSFFVVNSGILARSTSGLEQRLSTGSLIQVRMITPISIYFVLSCFYSLLSLAFSLPFSRKFGHSGFVVFWMLSWFGMTAAGLALESMITLLTIKYIQIFLILWIISNVSVCLWPIDTLPKVYVYGHAAPFYQISRGVRTIVFRTKNELGLNFGILFAWIVISSITLPLIQWYRRREEVQAWRAKEKEKTDSG